MYFISLQLDVNAFEIFKTAKCMSYKILFKLVLVLLDRVNWTDEMKNALKKNYDFDFIRGFKAVSFTFLGLSQYFANITDQLSYPGKKDRLTLQ